MDLSKLNKEILSLKKIDKNEALALLNVNLDELCHSALEITKHFFKDKFELCSISNGKCGRCTENCKFCAQSKAFRTAVEVSPLKELKTFFAEAKYNESKGVHRFSIVTSGRFLKKDEVEHVALVYKYLKERLNIELCASHGLLSYDDFVKLKASGVTRIHNNLESSERYFSSVCTTHKFADKIKAIQDAQRAGLDVCSGGIIGMGEDMEDRIDMALTLQELNIKSVPINVLNPIVGTPFENMKSLPFAEIKRTVAIFRHILPDSVLRLAGGRILFADRFEELYDCGINAMITGDMLTTCGLSIQSDKCSIAKQNRVLSIIK